MTEPVTGDLVTGEAVVLELRLARLASRALSLGIDLVVQGVLLLLGTLVVAGLSASVDTALGTTLGLLMVVAVIVGYPVAFETLTRGRTLGKLALGHRVVRDDGGPVGFRHALVRGLVGVVELWITIGVVALLTSLLSARGKRLGDMYAGTVVVRERLPVQGRVLPALDPALAGWAAGLDLTRLPDDLALAVRQFLSRAPDLAADVRESLGARLAGAVSASVTPAPPLPVPATAYLAAVLAERRNRELARLRPPGPAPPWSRAPAPTPAPAASAPAASAPSPAAPAADEPFFAPPG